MSDDFRLYLKETGWRVVINREDGRLYCHQQNENEAFHHRITSSELYVNRDTENFCLNCARKRGILSSERPTLEQRNAPTA